MFINPSVASLPKHQHIFGGHGCFKESVDNRDGGKACEGEDELPFDYKALLDCKKTVEDQTDAGYLKSLWDCKKTNFNDH